MNSIKQAKSSSQDKKLKKESPLKVVNDKKPSQLKNGKQILDTKEYDDITLQNLETGTTILKSIGIVGKTLVDKLRNKNTKQLIKEKHQNITNRELKKLSRLQSISQQKKKNLSDKIRSNKEFERNLKTYLAVDKSISIRSKKEQLNIGFDKKGKMYISTRKDRNIEIWRKASDKDITQIASNLKGKLYVAVLPSRTSKRDEAFAKKNDLILNKLKRENPEIAKNFKDINSFDFKDPNRFKGFVSITSPAGTTQNLKVLRANNKELILQSPYQKKATPIILSYKKLKNDRLKENTLAVSNLDKSTILGFNTKTKRYMLGIKKGEDTNWSSLKKSLSEIAKKDPERANQIQNSIKTGNYILSATIKPLGKDNKKLLVAQNNKGDLKVSTTGKVWRNPTLVEKLKIASERKKEIKQAKQKDNIINRAFRKLAI